MRIGIAFDLKPDTPPPTGAPDDLHEEFDHPVTIRGIAEVLQSLGHTVTLLGNGREFLYKVLAESPDLIFNLAEGIGISRSREARIPAVCEMLGIPCTGSDPLTVAAALDKDMTRRIAESAGITIPKGLIFSFSSEPYDGEYAEFPSILHESGLSLPVIAKPTCEGSSKGIRNRCLIHTAEEFGPVVMSLWQGYRQPVLVEEFIAGDEVTVGIVGNDPPRVVGLMRIVPQTPNPYFVYSLEVKRDYARQVIYECPPKLPVQVMRTIEAEALAAYEAMGCRDVARLDFRVRDGVPYFIEINPLPGLNPESSDLVLLAAGMGLGYAAMIGEIVEVASRRNGLNSLPPSAG